MMARLPPDCNSLAMVVTRWKIRKMTSFMLSEGNISR
jgi:hypothetical protein